MFFKRTGSFSGCKPWSSNVVAINQHLFKNCWLYHRDANYRFTLFQLCFHIQDLFEGFVS